jgi:hypothetical protein
VIKTAVWVGADLAVDQNGKSCHFNHELVSCPNQWIKKSRRLGYPKTAVYMPTYLRFYTVFSCLVAIIVSFVFF